MRDIFEELVVVKRSGQRVNFNSYKIAVAIKNAFDNVCNDYTEKDINKIYEDVLLYIESDYCDRKTINVEDIQDIIETKLKENNYEDVYISFSDYRRKRAASRGIFTVKSQHKFVKAMEKIIEDNALKSDNNYSPKDILFNYGKTVATEYAKSYIIDNKYLRAHEEGNIYIHDMESFSLGIVSHTHLNLSSILDEGLSINNFINVLISSKEEVNGYVNVSGLDFLLEKWVLNNFKNFFKEYLSNYLKVSGFISYLNIKKIYDMINRETMLPINMSDYELVIGSKHVMNIFECAYDDAMNKTEEILFESIRRLFVELNNVNGNNKKYCISFGSNSNYIGIIINTMIVKNISELEYLENVELVFKVNSLDNIFIDSVSELIINNKNILLSFPNSSYNRGINEVEYFGNGIRIYENNNDNDKYSAGRMIVSTTSINMARLGLKHENSSKDKFYEELDRLLEFVKNELLLSFEFIGNKNKDNYRFLFNGNIVMDEKLESGGKIRKVIKNSNLNIGLVGLKECISIICKDKKKEIKFLIEILNYINDKCYRYTEETKLNFFITEPYNSNAASYFMALDKSIYGIRSGITDSDSYDIICNIDDVKGDFKLNGKLQKLVTGGNMIDIVLPNNISHKEVKNKIVEAFKNDLGIVRFVVKDGEVLCK